MARVLILAYGNPMRCDDGLAWRGADELEGQFAATEVEILRSHQLTPELAEAVRGCEAVIFADAAPADGAHGEPGEVRIAPIVVPGAAARFSHHLSPSAVMGLAQRLYATNPRALSVTLTSECFDHGEALSPVVAAAIPDLVARIKALIQELLSSETLR